MLKDAASAAIYGAQAANGVVLITTKQGREGKAKVTFDGYFGWQTAPRKMQMLNSREYMTIMDEQQVNSGLAPYDWASMKAYIIMMHKATRCLMIQTGSTPCLRIMPRHRATP